ncbi:hypothetical protein [Rugosimonospora africana]|uniref:DUF3558 domain-containing protein n=1 Tax=Rugosimonospora africana TaxID=556532 RepID=A0A8J3VW21_9ACTN|nr:hypothetical protein [Rugosimonospora africana]GIH20920.1 hypothetical protein Raf01_90920 [Rugosimonospora africana]
MNGVRRLSRAVGVATVAGLSGLAALAGCSDRQPTGAHAAALPSCRTLVGRIPASALKSPTERFAQPTNAGTPTDFVPASTRLCPLIGVAADGKTPLQVQIWLNRPTLSPGGGDQAQTLGDLVVDETSQYCATVPPVTTGDPVTSSRCSGPTIDGQVAGLAIVHGPFVIGVRIDSAQAPGPDAQFPQMLQTEAQGIADAVAGGL